MNTPAQQAQTLSVQPTQAVQQPEVLGSAPGSESQLPVPSSVPEPAPPPKESFVQGFARAGAGERYAVDAQGNVVNTRATSPSAKGMFGSILAGMVVGAMAGAAAKQQPGEDAAGAGIRGSQEFLEKRDEQARGKAQRDFENRNMAQEAKNRDLEYKARIHLADLDAIKRAHEIEQAKANDPFAHQQLVNAATASSLVLEEKAGVLGLTNERTYADYASVPKADIDKFNRHETKVITMPDGSVKVWDRSFDARRVPNREDFEIKELVGLDPKTGKAEWKVVGHVKAGAGTVAQMEAELDKERKLLYEATDQNLKIEKTRSETAANYAQAAAARASAAGKTGVEGDIEVAARAMIEPRNLTALKDISSMRSDQRLKIYARAKELDPNFDVGLVNQRIRFLQSYEDPKGRAAINRQSINNILQHAGDLVDVNNNFRGRKEVRVLNTPINAIARQFGNTAYVNYATTLGVLKDELSLYFAGGYAPNVEQHAMWEKILSENATPAQVEAFAKEVVHLGLRRASTFDSQFKKNMGYKDPNMITPEAYNAGQKLGLKSELDKFDSGGQITGAAGGVTPAPGVPKDAETRIPAGAKEVIVNGKVVGYTTDGKTMTPLP